MTPNHFEESRESRIKCTHVHQVLTVEAIFQLAAMLFLILFYLSNMFHGVLLRWISDTKGSFGVSSKTNYYK